MDLLQTTILLFLILDPLGNVPLFLSLLKNVDPARRTRIIARELAIALVALVAFLLSGSHVMAFLALEPESISVAGGVILFIIAIKMLFPGAKAQYDDLPDAEPLVVPLAIPLVAGPSILATLMLMASRAPDRLGELLIALLIAWGASSLILLGSNGFQRLLGERGLVAVERLMGMLLVAMAVQMLLDGFASYMVNTLNEVVS